MVYDKLVRDEIPNIIKNKRISTKIVEGKVLEDYTLEKINEELDEFKLNPDLEEAADLIESVLKYIKVKFLNHDLLYEDMESAINLARQEKNESRGAFNKNIILLEVED